MTRTVRIIATATITLCAAFLPGSLTVHAQTPPAGGEAAPAFPAAPPVQSAQQGTPATVLDTQDYESLLGKSVRSANGDELGRVIDLIIDRDGRPRAAIIDFGGFLGVGSRKIAVDWRALRFTSDGKVGRLSLQLSRNQVRVSPEYKAGEPIVVLGPASPGPNEGDQATAPAVPAAASAGKPADKPVTEKAPEKVPDK